MLQININVHFIRILFITINKVSIHTYIYLFVCACVRACVRACVCIHIHMYIHARTHARKHARMHVTHTYIITLYACMHMHFSVISLTT